MQAEAHNIISKVGNRRPSHNPHISFRTNDVTFILSGHELEVLIKKPGEGLVLYDLSILNQQQKEIISLLRLYNHRPSKAECPRLTCGPKQNCLDNHCTSERKCPRLICGDTPNCLGEWVDYTKETLVLTPFADTLFNHLSERPSLLLELVKSSTDKDTAFLRSAVSHVKLLIQNGHYWPDNADNSLCPPITRSADDNVYNRRAQDTYVKICNNFLKVWP